ncbi:speckle-type POZ protein-like [Aphidius gifuensis]|uniref:speckle-type POZ protein-like n=1 Tax=Aphidius gifuensis TaxID=684658 RepID=UPI001CDB987D|nr:speckle-type POZ protein-like [Aphidius gifuensis]
MPTAGRTILICANLNIQSFKTSQLQTKLRISMNDLKEIITEYNFSRIPAITQWVSYRTNLSCQLLSNPSQYLPNDELKICCTISMSTKPTNIYFDIISTVNKTPKLSVDWKKLLLSEKSADVTIKVGQKSFRAIKGILAVRSPVFAAMFDHEQFEENKKNEVVIDDIDEDVFEEFLHYIYTDESPNVDKMTMELLAVADKYQVDCLKNICEEIICKTINVNNAANILVFSDKYNLEKLDKKCLEFIKKNLQAVLSNKRFQVYQKKYPEIFVGVLQKLLSSAKSVTYN